MSELFCAFFQRTVHRHFVASLGALLLLISPALAAPEKSKGAPTNATDKASPYFLQSAQLDSPLRPFAHLGNTDAVRIRAAVVTMPDPIETRLARAFDTELAALVNAFQTQSYVVDGFVFTWTPRKADMPADERIGYSPVTRGQPSVLLFRRDAWRECAAEPDKACEEKYSEYFVIFIVGETPTVGVHPRAFQRAARCALALNMDEPPYAGRRRLDKRWQHRDCDHLSALESPTLRIIGPSFSGSIESIANSVDKVIHPDARTSVVDLKIDLISPSASVGSNQYLQHHPYISREGRPTISYMPLAWSVEDQLQALAKHLGPQIKGGRIVILAEQSSFGLGVVTAASRLESLFPGESPPIEQSQIRWAQFPQNISAIRAEYANQQQEQDAARRQLLPSHVLELSLAGVDRSSDLPPIYQPMLSSRSDELLLSQTFATLRKWTDPAVVVVVATDIRDRLFMLNQVHRELPGALRVVFEQDNLLVHPDYRDANRGTLVVSGGDTDVCLEPGSHTLDSCAGKKLRFPFGTDYAANMFRAVVLATMAPTCRAPFYLDRHQGPRLNVATLAGFQRLPELNSGKLVAAESRVAVQRPIYAGLIVWGLASLLIAIWLGLYRQREAVLLFLPLEAVRDLAATLKSAPEKFLLWLSRKIGSHNRLGKWLSGRKHKTHQLNAMESKGKPSVGRSVCALFLAVCAIFVSTQAVRSLDCQRAEDFGPRTEHGCAIPNALAHGHDRWALYSLAVIFAYTALLALWRFTVWNHHCRCYAGFDIPSRPLPGILRRHGYAVPIAVVLLLLPFLWVLDLRGLDADESYLGFPMLILGTFFLALFGIELHRWRRLCAWLSGAIKTINEEGKRSGWPTPFMLGQIPRNPLSLVVETEDLKLLHDRNDAAWHEQTASLVSGVWHFATGTSGFAMWERQLVAEMKVASVAVRSAGWCATLAPALALAFVQVYPLAFERILTVSAVALLSLSFAAIVYAALVLEQDCLLGPLFTRDKDRLSVTGALATIWPKLVGFAILLCAIFLPDVWEWLHNASKSINSL